MIKYRHIITHYGIIPLLVTLLLSGCASNPEYDGLDTSDTMISTDNYVLSDTSVLPDTSTNIALAPSTITDPLGRNTKHPVPPVAQDLWERVRLGFRLDVSDDWRVQRQLSSITANPESLELGVKRAEPYLHFIVEEAEKRNMPLELALLPAVESGFRPLARSRSAALGLWQFIPSTAREKGLESNWWYEGRCDIMASTRAALDYLQELADQFGGDWELALAAYNAGPGRIQRAIKANENKGLDTDFWSLSLPNETREYVPKLLALAMVLKNPEYHGIYLPPLANTPFFKEVDLPGPIPLKQAASLAGVDQAVINGLNPGLRRGIAGIGGNYPLLLPTEQATNFEERLAQITPQQRWTRLHHYRVRQGDTISGIASQFGVSDETLKAVNGLSNPQLSSGQRLVIPVIKGTATDRQKTDTGQDDSTTPQGEVIANTTDEVNVSSDKVAATANSNDSQSTDATTDQQNAENPPPDNNVTADNLEWRTHVVKPGEYLVGIARSYGVTTAQLADWNNLSPTTSLRKSQVLRLYASSNIGSTKQIRYRVQKGDSLRQISQRFNVSVEDLRRWNRLYTDTLIPGRHIKVRVSTPMNS